MFLVFSLLDLPHPVLFSAFADLAKMRWHGVVITFT
jgi:hypothetical protein